MTPPKVVGHTPIRDALVEAAAAKLNSSPELRALLEIARSTFDPWAAATASDAIVVGLAEELDTDRELAIGALVRSAVER